MLTKDLRKEFIKYFADKQHKPVASSNLVPQNDATLLFTNAGMVQFKDKFLGLEKTTYDKAVTIQKCLRAGGKHNDLDQVGYTKRHHTFFEMLGNFSFGAYFKREAIEYAWVFLTKVLKLPEEKLWVTVYEEDEETADLWLKEMGVSKERFSRCGAKDNFWSMGDTGPCGPCTEIFYDHGPQVAGGPPGSIDADGDRYVEIWNLVFMQYNRDKDGNLEPLPNPSVDTGMGLERIAAVMQGVEDNYKTDGFRPIISAAHALASKSISAELPAFKVIADHLRSAAFLIAEGVYPGNEGRNYVVRRLIRRAIRYGQSVNLPQDFLARLLPVLIDLMGETYPELEKHQENIINIFNQETTQFLKTLEQGLNIFKQELSGIKNIVPGSLVFKLYDTYGFPVDLTKDIALEHNLAIDEEGFEACMQKQKERSKATNNFVSQNVNLQVSSSFYGYDKNSLITKIIALIAEDKLIDTLEKDVDATIILEDTPFYAESGGQVGDTGTITCADNIFEVYDTQKSGTAILHKGKLVKGKFTLGSEVKASINIERRQMIRAHHSATHLLHAALRHVFGESLQQKGSLVAAEGARFDFSLAKGLSLDEIKNLDALVNTYIRSNTKVITEHMDIEAARNSGAIALFGEKYTEEVRVLSMGEVSKELCGGTHVDRTGDIGYFKILREFGIASGIRRIEFVAGKPAAAWVEEQVNLINSASTKLKTQSTELTSSIEKLLEAHKSLEKTCDKYQQKLFDLEAQAFIKTAHKSGDISIIIEKIIDCDMKALRKIFDLCRSKLEKYIIVLVGVTGSNMQVIAGLSKNLNPALKAPLLVQELCGTGGGRDEQAQGGTVLDKDLDSKLKKMQDHLMNYIF